MERPVVVDPRLVATDGRRAGPLKNGPRNVHAPPAAVLPVDATARGERVNNRHLRRLLQRHPRQPPGRGEAVGQERQLPGGRPWHPRPRRDAAAADAPAGATGGGTGGGSSGAVGRRRRPSPASLPRPPPRLAPLPITAHRVTVAVAIVVAGDAVVVVAGRIGRAAAASGGCRRLV